MSTYEELFNESVLSVVAPHASLGLPQQDESMETWKEWLGRVEREETDRKMAFFDENLDFLLLLRFPHNIFESDDITNVNADTETETETSPRPQVPPIQLLSFLAHLQISYDASYIAPVPQQLPSSSLGPGPGVGEVSLNEPLNRPTPPPRTVSGSLGAGLGSGSLHLGVGPGTGQGQGRQNQHPSIFPPHTPHPVPSAVGTDRQYVQAQGTPLRTGVWGEGGRVGVGMGGGGDAVRVVRGEGEWVVVFKMSVAVTFMATKVADPLLCLTVSTTLREKPVPVTPPREVLAGLIEAAGGLPEEGPGSPGGEHEDGDSADRTGFEEVNLLEGLTIGTSFDDDEPGSLSLPSTRLGSSIRRSAYSLPPLSPEMDDPLPSGNTTLSSTSRIATTTLRKSFRKTLQTVSGFRVRMRTVFVPYFMLPPAGSQNKPRPNARRALNGSNDDSDDSDNEALYERELREAGNEEHTVVLCVEVENSGESAAGFAVESVNVVVGGEGARTQLIGWGDDSGGVFPLLIGPQEQYNLLYAVTFVRAPENDEFSLARGRNLPGAPPVQQQLQRAVTIILNGRPYEELSASPDGSKTMEGHLTYPTHVFPSRWNCVLDLAAQVRPPIQVDPVTDSAAASPGQHSALPTPASPFPMTFPRSGPPRPLSLPQLTRSSMSGSGTGSGTGTGNNTPVSAIAGSKRFTLGFLDPRSSSSTTTTASPHLSASTTSARTKVPTSPMNYRSDTALLNPTNQRDIGAQSGLQSPVSLSVSTTPIGSPGPSALRAAYIPPSLTVPAFTRGPTTTYAPLGGAGSVTPPVPRMGSPYMHSPQEDSISSPIGVGNTSFGGGSPGGMYDRDGFPPPTPAYPAFPPSPLPPGTPHWQGPVASLQSGDVGPVVDIPRARAGTGGGGGGGGRRESAPGTPMPRVGAPGGFAQMQMQQMRGAGLVGVGGEARDGNGHGDGPSEPVVVSVGLLFGSSDEGEGEGGLERKKGRGKGKEKGKGKGKIYPLDEFTLDIFVFNRSSWTRRFEVSYPDARKQRRERMRVEGGEAFGGGSGSGEDAPGILPLENRIRIGPLRPSTCQSVRMRFLALKPGVHSVEVLTLTDVQTGFTMNLRSVMDVVVHEHEPSDSDSEL